MSLNPDVQKKAQAELDDVVGPNRLPDHRDRESLPYVNAILKESLRWHNAAPFGVPHCAGEDIEYRGYFIPKGTTFLANIWYVLKYVLKNWINMLPVGLACMIRMYTMNQIVSCLTDSCATARSTRTFATQAILYSGSAEGEWAGFAMFHLLADSWCHSPCDQDMPGARLCAG